MNTHKTWYIHVVILDLMCEDKDMIIIFTTAVLQTLWNDCRYIIRYITWEVLIHTSWDIINGSIRSFRNSLIANLFSFRSTVLLPYINTLDFLLWPWKSQYTNTCNVKLYRYIDIKSATKTWYTKSETKDAQYAHKQVYILLIMKFGHFSSLWL